MAVGTCPAVRSSSVSLPIAVTICESPNVKPVDVRTTQARCPQAHRRNNNRPEQNKKCVTHVAGQNCYPCPRLLRGGYNQHCGCFQFDAGKSGSKTPDFWNLRAEAGSRAVHRRHPPPCPSPTWGEGTVWRAPSQLLCREL